MKNLANLLAGWKGKKVLMAVYPHPDDETMGAGGLLLAAKKLGFTTIVLKELVAALPTGKRPKLFWNTLWGRWRGRILNQAVADYAVKPDYVLHLGGNVVRKWRAVKAHKSQALGNNIPIPMFWALVLFGRQEWYHEVDLEKDYPYRFVPFSL